jgi:predicted transcriptional regulator
MERKRSRIDIISDILGTLLAKPAGLKPTHLMYKGNLSHGQMQQYLKELTEKGFVSRTRKGTQELIVITDEGAKFKRKIEEMKAFEQGFAF